MALPVTGIVSLGVGTTKPAEKSELLGGSYLQRGGKASDQYAPTQIATVALTNPQWVKVVGPYAYTIFDTTTNGLQIVDISDPSSPSLVSTFNFGSSPVWADVTGRYLYVVDSGFADLDLKIIDVADPANPAIVGTLGMGTNVNFITVSGKYAYITEETAGVLKIVDISDPTAPQLVSTLTFAAGSAFPRSVVVSGTFAYINGSDTNDFNVIDVSDPTAPSVVGSLSLGSFGEYIAVSGKYVFLPDQNPTPTIVRIIDVSDSTAPVQVGTATLSNTAFPRSLRVAGNYLYVMDEADRDLWVFSIADPTAPVLVGKVDLTDFAPNALDILGKHLYIIDAGGDVLKIIDISGIEVQSANIQSLQAGTAQIIDDLDVGKDQRIRGGLAVGGNSLFEGDVAVAGAFTGGSAASFSPSGNQAGLSIATALQMMVQDFQDDADWTVTNNTTLTANRTGRYKFSFMWTFQRTAGAANDVFSVDLFLNGATLIQGRVIIYPDAIGNNQVSGCMVIPAAITATDTVQTRIFNITTNTYTFIAAQSSLLIERMRG